MTIPEPVIGARLFVALTLAVLPAHTRDRYREEFSTELCDLRPGAQVREAASMLFGSPSLRAALTNATVAVTPAIREPGTDLRCRIGVHLFVLGRDEIPEERGHRYLRCDRCGKRKADVANPLPANDVTAMAQWPGPWGSA